MWHFLFSSWIMIHFHFHFHCVYAFACVKNNWNFASFHIHLKTNKMHFFLFSYQQTFKLYVHTKKEQTNKQKTLHTFSIWNLIQRSWGFYLWKVSFKNEKKKKSKCISFRLVIMKMNIKSLRIRIISIVIRKLALCFFFSLSMVNDWLHT